MARITLLGDPDVMTVASENVKLARPDPSDDNKQSAKKLVQDNRSENVIDIE